MAEAYPPPSRLAAVLLDAVRADTAEKAQSAREKFCVGCGLFVFLLILIV